METHARSTRDSRSSGEAAEPAEQEKEKAPLWPGGRFWVSRALLCKAGPPDGCGAQGRVWKSEPGLLRTRRMGLGLVGQR